MPKVHFGIIHRGLAIGVNGKAWPMTATSTPPRSASLSDRESTGRRNDGRSRASLTGCRARSPIRNSFSASLPTSRSSAGPANPPALGRAAKALVTHAALARIDKMAQAGLDVAPVLRSQDALGELEEVLLLPRHVPSLVVNHGPSRIQKAFGAELRLEHQPHDGMQESLDLAIARLVLRLEQARDLREARIARGGAARRLLSGGGRCRRSRNTPRFAGSSSSSGRRSCATRSS